MPQAQPRPLSWTLRPVTLADLDLVWCHREAMALEAGRAPDTVAQMSPHGKAWFAARIRDGSYEGFIAEVEGVAMGGVGFMVIDWPPHSLHARQTQRGYVLNLFVHPEFRRRGLARALMDAAEGELRERGVQYLVLHATALGQPLYEALGWTVTNEMGKQLFA